MQETEKNLDSRIDEIQKKLDMMESKRHADFIFFENRLQELQGQLNIIQTQYENGAVKKGGCLKLLIIPALVVLFVIYVIEFM